MSRAKRPASFPLSLSPGAKSLGIVLPDAPLRRTARRARWKPPVMAYLYPPGTVVAEFAVLARAVPWMVPRRSGPAHKFAYLRLKAWQAAVRQAAVVAMAGPLPHAGPFVFVAHWDLIHASSSPDVTNVMKSSEDALQGIVFMNDNMNRGTNTIYNPDANADRTYIKIIAL